MELAENAGLLGSRRHMPKLNVPIVVKIAIRPIRCEVAHAVDDEVVRGRCSRLCLSIRSRSGIRADADQLPEHERHRQVARDHDAEHRERKQGQYWKNDETGLR